MTSTRKVVLFIVEGPSDEAALGSIFTKIFNNDAVKFEVIHGDVTTSCQDPAKMREHVRNEILKHLSRDRGYGWKDLERIVVICDTDGAFVPSSCIEASSDGRLHYEEAFFDKGINKQAAESAHKNILPFPQPRACTKQRARQMQQRRERAASA